MLSPYTIDTILYVIIAYKLLTTLVLPRLYKRASDKWKLRLITFTADNDGKVIAGGGKYKLLFIAVPSSGAGRAMDIFDECIEELQKREENFTIEVYVTKSSDDTKNLIISRSDDISGYYGIVLLGGDSSITELIQAPLAQNNVKWVYPPVLHLPGGSGGSQMIRQSEQVLSSCLRMEMIAAQYMQHT